MAEAKPIASLTSGLLARKGAATPAMRRPMMGFGRAVNSGIVHDDLGWNDMGFDVPDIDAEPAVAMPPVATGLTPMTPVAAPVSVPQVVVEREQLAERVAQVAAPVQPAPRPAKKQALPQPAPQPIAVNAARKSAFTLRLDGERHLKLRLACAIAGRSAQQVVTEALDAFLKGLPEIDRLAQQLPHPRGEY